ncbi:MAG: hypothetical protein IJ174_05145 [Clostridia bacterium]|nr:hypothetical protein [Clostridia bacterium]
MGKKKLCLALALMLLLGVFCAYADADQCLPWLDVEWDEIDALPEGNVYVGVYECAYTISLDKMPEIITGSLMPVDASKAERLWTKALNDCWSFYGVSPLETVDDETGEVTCLFEQDDFCVSLRFAGLDTGDPWIEFTVINEKE